MKTFLLQGEEVIFSRIAGSLFGCYGEFAAYSNVRQIEKELAKGEADEPYIVVFTPDSSPEQRLNLLEKIRGRGSIKVIQLGEKSADEEQNQLSWPLSAMKLHRFLSSDGFVAEQPPPFAKKIVADLINSLGGDEAFVREETESFFALLPQKLAEMEKNEAQGLSEAVHKLSSTSALYGAIGLSLLFLELEYLLRSGAEVIFADWKRNLRVARLFCLTYGEKREVSKVEMDQIERLFYQEVLEMMEEAAYSLVEAEKNGSAAEKVPDLFRLFHSIKGSAQMVNMEELSRLSHQLESLLDAVREGRRSFDAELLNLILEVIEVVENDINCRVSGMTDLVWPERQLGLIKKISLMDRGVASAPKVQVESMKKKEDCDAKKNRWLRLEFSLEKNCEMAGAVATLIEARYRQSGNLLHGDLQAERIRMILNTDWEDERLRQWCNSIEINAINIVDLWNTQQAAASGRETLDFAMLEEGQRLFNGLHECFAERKNELQKLRKIIAWSEAVCSEVKERLLLLNDCMVFYPGLGAKEESWFLYQRLLRHAWEALYRSVCNKSYYYECKWSEFADLKNMLTASAEIKYCFLEIDEWMIDSDVAAFKELKRQFAQRKIRLRFWSSEVNHHYRIGLEALIDSHEISVWRSPYEACFFNGEKSDEE